LLVLILQWLGEYHLLYFYNQRYSEVIVNQELYVNTTVISRRYIQEPDWVH
jgi:hypothetical protein